MTVDEIKKNIGIAAANSIEDGMVVGLGTGSTVFYFIERLITRCRNGLNIRVVSSSEKSSLQAIHGNIQTLDINTISSIDITVDGADEIDPKKRLIKGAGGALLREKILASASKEMLVIADESKLVKQLGSCKLPVEIIPFATLSILKKINDLGYHGAIRMNQDGSKYTTDNGNLIYDIKFKELLNSPEAVHENLIHIAGVVETGFFFDLADRVMIGYENGQIEIRK
ncbi:MAG: ribose-5-phosphate isomerase RpiA [Simkaniaceae bacterium]|nr:ribose-5-phosphate isomerase RpiA [Simkaniaceae bacterium]